MPEWCTGIPVLVRWGAIAVLRMAAVGFALCVCVRAYVCVVCVRCCLMYMFSEL